MFFSSPSLVKFLERWSKDIILRLPSSMCSIIANRTKAYYYYYYTEKETKMIGALNEKGEKLWLLVLKLKLSGRGESNKSRRYLENIREGKRNE